MAAFDQSQDMTDAMLEGVADLVNVDDDPAYLLLYDTTRPSTPGDPESEAALVTIVFAEPAAAVVAHELVFTQGDPSGDLILNQGSATWGRLFNGAGTWLGDADVTDMAGAGPVKISGTTGTLLYAGARAIIGEFKMV